MTILLLCLLAFAVPARAGEIAPFAQGSFAALREAHAGKPLIAHFWSVSCPTCVGELPRWGKIAREPRGFDLVVVNTDLPSERARVEVRLEKAGLREAENFAFADEFVERLYFEVDRTWRGELPFDALVAANGELLTVTGPLDESFVASWLKAPREATASRPGR